MGVRKNRKMMTKIMIVDEGEDLREMLDFLFRKTGSELVMVEGG
jgi:hypothetical protein